MHLQLLKETPVVSVYYDSWNDWLFVDWRGDLTLAIVQAECLTIAQCFLEGSYPRILNNNSDVTSITADVPLWLAREYLPHLGLAGIEYLAWVYSPNLMVKFFADLAVRQLRAPAVALFDDLATAYAWLQHTRFPHPNDSQSASERHAELAQRVAAFSIELAHYQQAAGRSSDLKPKAVVR